jgi:hypothetical protein
MCLKKQPWKALATGWDPYGSKRCWKRGARNRIPGRIAGTGILIG